MTTNDQSNSEARTESRRLWATESAKAGVAPLCTALRACADGSRIPETSSSAPRWGESRFVTLDVWEAAAATKSATADFPVCNEEYTRAWVSTAWRQAAYAAQDLRLAEPLRQLDPRSAQIDDRMVPHRAYFAALHRNLMRIVDEGDGCVEEVIRDVMDLRRSVEPFKADLEPLGAEVFFGIRWNASMYFDWLSTQIAEHATDLSRIPAASEVVEIGVVGTFARRGTAGWTLQFDTESGEFKNRVGFEYLRRLLMQPNQLIAVEVLEGVDRHAQRPEETRQPVRDRDTLNALGKHYGEIANELREARERADEPEVARLEHESAQVQRELRSAAWGRRPSRAFDGPRENCRKRVGKALRSAISTIARQCPGLGEHLRVSIPRMSSARPMYAPDRRVNWTF